MIEILLLLGCAIVLDVVFLPSRKRINVNPPPTGKHPPPPPNPPDKNGCT